MCISWTDVIHQCIVVSLDIERVDFNLKVMKSCSQVLYSTFFLALSAFLVLLTRTSALFTFNAYPEVLLIGQPCTLSCQGESKDGLKILVYGVSDSNVHAVFPTSTNQDYDIDTKWREDDEVEVVVDRRRGILNVTFIARRNDQERLVKCLSDKYQYGTHGYEVREMFLELQVEKLPSVLELYMTDEDGIRIQYTTSNSVVSVICRVLLGFPKSEHYNLTVPGMVIRSQVTPPDYLDDYEGYQQAAMQVDTQMSFKDNRRPIRCTVRNRRRRAKKELRVNVLFPVQDITMSYNGLQVPISIREIKVAAGESIYFSAHGNPSPKITLHFRNQRHQRWTLQDFSGLGRMKLQIPSNAEAAAYEVTITAVNIVLHKYYPKTATITINVVRTRQDGPVNDSSPTTPTSIKGPSAFVIISLVMVGVLVLFGIFVLSLRRYNRLATAALTKFLVIDVIK